MKNPKFIKYRDGVGEYRWQLVAKNGKTIADSGEGYKAEADCDKGIRLVKEVALDADMEDRTKP